MILSKVLKLKYLEDSNVVAGFDSLDREVKSISVLEVADEKIKNWVLKDQIFITAFYAIMNNIEKQKEVIKALNEKQAAALVICHLDLFTKEIHPEVIELCNNLSFPLIIAKSERSYIEILNPVILNLMGNPNQEYNYEISMQNKLIEYIASKKDLNTIYRTMSLEYKKKIYFLDINNKTIYPKDTKTFTDFFKVNREIKKQNDEYSIVDINNERVIIFPIRCSGIEYGKILAEYNEKEVERDINLLRSISRICTLISTKNSRISQLETIKKQEYISDLLTWNFRSDEVAIKLGENVNWDIRNKSRLILVNLNDIQKNIDIKTNVYDQFLNDVLYKKIKEVVKNDNKNNLLGLRSDIFIVLMENDEYVKDRAKKLSDNILKTCRLNYKGSISIGISSNIKKPRNIPEAYLQAKDVASIGREFFGENKAIFFDDLGFYSILKDIKKINNFNNIHDNIFKKIKKIDEEKKLDLYNTLKVLIYNNLNTEKVAEIMYIHRNTVNYRKKEIEKILGYKPWEMPHLMNTLLEIITDGI